MCRFDEWRVVRNQSNGMGSALRLRGGGSSLGLLFSGWVLGGQPDLARVNIEGDRPMVRPKGMARILAFYRSLWLDRTASGRWRPSIAAVSLRWACAFVPRNAWAAG